jgi:hypothetical protein
MLTDAINLLRPLLSKLKDTFKEDEVQVEKFTEGIASLNSALTPDHIDLLKTVYLTFKAGKA